VDGGGTRARLLVVLVLAPQAPGVGPARRARVLATRRDLLVVERQLRLVGARHEHVARPTCSPCSACSMQALSCWARRRLGRRPERRAALRVRTATTASTNSLSVSDGNSTSR